MLGNIITQETIAQPKNNLNIQIYEGRYKIHYKIVASYKSMCCINFSCIIMMYNLGLIYDE